MLSRLSAPLACLLLVGSEISAEPVAGNRIVDPREVIALEAGVWDAVIASPARAADGKSKTVTGVQVNELRSGGMWMLNRMTVLGGAYEGTGIWGFDPRTGRYSGVWVDNGSERIRMDDGTWNPDTNTMTWIAEIERPNGQKFRMRATSIFAGNTRTYRSFALRDGGETPLSTVVFTRRDR
jgi:hypothetical protein